MEEGESEREEGREGGRRDSVRPGGSHSESLGMIMNHL